MRNALAATARTAIVAAAAAATSIIVFTGLGAAFPSAQVAVPFTPISLSSPDTSAPVCAGTACAPAAHGKSPLVAVATDGTAVYDDGATWAIRTHRFASAHQGLACWTEIKGGHLADERVCGSTNHVPAEARAFGPYPTDVSRAAYTRDCVADALSMIKLNQIPGLTPSEARATCAQEAIKHAH